MNKPYGVQGEIINFPFKDLHETFYNQDGIEIEIKDGILYVGTDDEKNLEEAKDIACLYLAAWSLRQNIKTKVDFNHSWQTNSEGNRHPSLEPSDNVQLTERLQIQTTTHQVTQQGKAF